MQEQQTFQPAQGFQTTGGFGLQMPQIGFQGLQQPGFQSLAAPQFGQQAAEPTTFTIGIPGGFQFVSDPSQVAAYNGGASGATSPYAGGANRETTATLRTRDAGLATKKPKKKTCLCC